MYFPLQIIVMYLQVLGYERNQNLMQYSWNYMNDSLRTDVFVRYQPEMIACACIYLTARKLKLPLPKNPSWYSLFGVTEGDIRDVCFRILKLYNRAKVSYWHLMKQWFFLSLLISWFIQHTFTLLDFCFSLHSKVLFYGYQLIE